MLCLVLSEHLSLGGVLRTLVLMFCDVRMELTWVSREPLQTISGSNGPAPSENSQITASRKRLATSEGCALGGFRCSTLPPFKDSRSKCSAYISSPASMVMPICKSALSVSDAAGASDTDKAQCLRDYLWRSCHP